MPIEHEQLLASGTAFTVERCDTSEETHIRRLPPLSGVWHAAGVLADGVLHSQSAMSLARVAAPKAHGGEALHRMSAPMALDACALFSSVAALLGGAGHANYSAANAWLDALSLHSRFNGRLCVSVQWGAWAEIGMASRGAASERMAVMEAAIGLGRIGVSQGLAALQAATQHRAPALLAMMPVQWHRVLGGGGVVPSFLSEMAPRTALTRRVRLPQRQQQRSSRHLCRSRSFWRW